MNELMKIGEADLCKYYTNEMLHEMRMLKIIYDENPGLIKLLPIFPDKISKYVYDCASWGQYIGGTHNNKDEGFTTNAHLIGRKINQKKYDVKWVKENGYKLPFVIDMENKEIQPIYNLHIHSKNLERWAS